MIDIILINPNAVFSQFFNFIEKKKHLFTKSQVSSLLQHLPNQPQTLSRPLDLTRENQTILVFKS